MPMNIRPLTLADVPFAVPLMAELGYPVEAGALAGRFAALSRSPDDVVFVAQQDDGKLAGLIACHSFEMLHRPGRLGRITALVVAEAFRGRGIGRQLLSAAEDHLRAHGCIKLEVTSAGHRDGAHAFYESQGYAEQRVRFVKDSAK
jgi:ribosomal protein S18 acetylase RimI-like enzyme